MSAKPKSASRFAGQLSTLAGRTVGAVGAVGAIGEEQPSAPPLQANKDDGLETFSSHMTKGRKRRLKMAATREDKKIYEIVGELVDKWLQENHPDLK